MRGEVKMVWACVEEECWVYWEEDAKDGTAKLMRRFMGAVRKDM